MKKIFTVILTCLLLSASASAQIIISQKAENKNQHTNLLEKVPEQGKYVGYAGVELLSPGFFGDGGVNFGITTTHGAMLRDRIFVGGGVGYFADFRNGKGVIPIFADGRYFFRSQFQRRIYPHIGARAGAQIATEGGVGGFVQLALGLRVPFTEKFAMNIEVGPQYATHYEREHKQNMISTGKPFTTAGNKFQFFARLNFEF